MARELQPQPGPQEMFLSTSADIAIYGGAAGGGKTYGLLLECLRHKNRQGYTAVVFRKNATQITIAGGLKDESMKMFAGIKGATYRATPRPQWEFHGKSSVSFAHLDRNDDVHSWQGGQIAGMLFDELTHFSEYQFVYMLSRNRTTCGIKPYMRATCNPDADSWVAGFIAWWIDQDTGYPIPNRSGKIRWMIRRDEVFHWADSREELWERFGLNTPEERDEPKSVTFIASTLQDNKILLESDPSYLANLKAQPLVERERLLYGNWKIKPAAGMYFKRTQVGEILLAIPGDVIRWVRAWDLAATAESENSSAACTAGVLMGKRKNGRYIVADVINVRLSAADVRRTIKLTAESDREKYRRVRIRLPKDPGQAGKEQAQSYIKYLAGFDVTAVAESGSKEVRVEPLAAQWQGGNVDVLAAPWNEMYFIQLESFPVGNLKDMVDASSSAFAELEGVPSSSVPPAHTDLGRESYWNGR